ncbi:inorganic pyrophosphatase/exopolyphosphatase [Skeletonema marinoi]|uniref:Inorganic pyrophosphatase/exopolyphosphatase n=1 Tax=Skeletonema marinoi TaxID=267567 RepID=A0AAD8Y2T3_9STRA|nr:inorganic pyrophosphatase/exopolyphosphatase [Skeletonema marinoi]
MARQLLSLLLLLQIIIATITLFRSLAAVDAFVPFVARNIRFSASKKMALSSSSQQHQPTVNTSFVSFLESTAPASLQSKDVKRINNVIIGNEAGDADSIISALTLGYVTSFNNNSPPDNNTVQVPIVSIPRAEMELRRDAALLLDMVGINVQKLLYIDDDIVVTKHLLPSSADDSSDTLLDSTITLVDHNRLRPMFSHLNSLVTEIVDHHKDESHHEKVVADSGKRIIAFENGHATVASTCTLVAERLFQSMTDDSSIKIDGALGLSLLGVILLDSINMKPEAKKGTPRDEEAIQQLLQRTDWSSCADTVPSLMDQAALDSIFPGGRCNMPDRNALFDALIGAKSDPKFWLEMSAVNCLRIDYKKFIVNDRSSIGLSSVIITMDDLLAKDGFIDSMKAFIASEDVNLFGVLGVTFFDDKPKRELLLAGDVDSVVDSFAQFLLEHPDAADLEMVEREDCMNFSQDGMKIRVFRQGNPKGSRKQIAPLLLQHASTMESL